MSSISPISPMSPISPIGPTVALSPITPIEAAAPLTSLMETRHNDQSAGLYIMGRFAVGTTNRVNRCS